ncbi:tyrosine-type recombinase/integrase [Candidatus Daviesbacteria bacterium]|nr:tyrosine-type recombinase/integrase [Candidatus Daviesbacteria bacterium]
MPNSANKNWKTENLEPEKMMESYLDLLDDFFLFLQTNNYSPTTLYHYKSDLAIFDNFLKSRNLRVKDLDKRAVFEFKAYLSSDERETAMTHLQNAQRLSSASINRCLSAVRAYLRFLIDQDYQSPVMPDQFKMVKRERAHPNVAEFNDLVALIEAPSRIEQDPIIAARNRAILEVLFATGMRISELVSLNRRDLNIEGKIFITGKGRKQRFVYLTERAQQYVDQYLRLRQDNQQALFIPLKTRSKDKLSSRLTPRYIQERLKTYRENLRINLPTTPHSFRHGFATYLAEEGASPAAIQILLGHESLNTTTRYVNASDKFAQETHRKFHPLAKKSQHDK